MSARENVLMTMAYSSEWFLGTHKEALAQHRKELDDYRAEVLREAAERLRSSERLRDYTDDHMSDVNAAADELDNMAAEGAT
jgi:hypothetical protein